MPAADAHGRGSEDDGVTGLFLRDRPIDLVDIARVLGASAQVERPGAPIRNWRDDLTMIQESLSYARTILAADVEILSHASSPEAKRPQSVADDLSSVLARGYDDRLSGPGDEDIDQLLDGLENIEGLEGLDEGVFARTDHLLAAHREMARLDMSSSVAVMRLLAQVTEQLAILTERQAAVEARLQQIRAAVIRRYRDAAAPARDRPA